MDEVVVDVEEPQLSSRASLVVQPCRVHAQLQLSGEDSEQQPLFSQ